MAQQLICHPIPESLILRAIVILTLCQQTTQPRKHLAGGGHRRSGKGEDGSNAPHKLHSVDVEPSHHDHDSQSMAALEREIGPLGRGPWAKADQVRTPLSFVHGTKGRSIRYAAEMTFSCSCLKQIPLTKTDKGGGSPPSYGPWNSALLSPNPYPLTAPLPCKIVGNPLKRRALMFWQR
jgi:hypothetical protein